MAIDSPGVEFALRDASRPLVVLGPSLGTSVTTLWGRVAERLVGACDVIGWDLPGHGHGHGDHGNDDRGEVTIPSLAASVLAVLAQAQTRRGDPGAPVWYAGVSVGGAVGLQLALDAPDSVAGAMIVSSGARIGDRAAWLERAGVVERDGTASQLDGSRTRWFSPRFADGEPAVVDALLADLAATSATGYAAVCRALSSFDVRDRLAEIDRPVLAVAARHDVPTPVTSLAEIASGVVAGRLVVLDNAAHLPPVEEAPLVADLLAEFVGVDRRDRSTTHRAGLGVRREVLSAEHVERATAGASSLTAEFQDFITRYAWGEIWTRPGLDRRTRSAITITALIAGGHWDELAMHVRGALRNGLTEAELREVLLQSAIYCSVPSANRAFAIADRVLREV